MKLEPAVFVVDDDPAVRTSMAFLVKTVGLQVETFASAADFLDELDPDRPGCIVLDIRMPGMSGLDLQDELGLREIDLPIIIVTGYGDVSMAVRAMKTGAVEFLEKPVAEQVLLDQIQRAVAHSLERHRLRLARRKIAERRNTLTPREDEVMRLVVAGLSNREIANRLAVSPKTVESHRAKIMHKMEAESLAHLVRMNLDESD